MTLPSRLETLDLQVVSSSSQGDTADHLAIVEPFLVYQQQHGDEQHPTKSQNLQNYSKETRQKVTEMCSHRNIIRIPSSPAMPAAHGASWPKKARRAWSYWRTSSATRIGQTIRVINFTMRLTFFYTCQEWFSLDKQRVMSLQRPEWLGFKTVQSRPVTAIVKIAIGFGESSNSDTSIHLRLSVVHRQIKPDRDSASMSKRGRLLSTICHHTSCLSLPDNLLHVAVCLFACQFVCHPTHPICLSIC